MTVGQLVVTVTARVEVPPLFGLRARITNLLTGLAKRLVDCKVTVNVTTTSVTSVQSPSSASLKDKLKARQQKSVRKQRP